MISHTILTVLSVFYFTAGYLRKRLENSKKNNSNFTKFKESSKLVVDFVPSGEKDYFEFEGADEEADRRSARRTKRSRAVEQALIKSPQLFKHHVSHDLESELWR